MGFRTSFYHYPKSTIEAEKDVTSLYDEYTGDSDLELVEMHKEHEIIYDAFTYSVLDVCDDLEYCSPIFTNLDEKYSDYMYRRMNKEQFAKFAKYCFKKYIDVISKQHIGNLEDSLQKEILELAENKEAYNHHYSSCDNFESLPTSVKVLQNQYDLNLDISYRILNYQYFDKLFDNKWRCTGIFDTYSNILNLVHIYHMMDWDNEDIVVIGC